MTLHPGERKLYAVRHMVWLTKKEKEEVEEFHRQFGGEFVATEQAQQGNNNRMEQ